MMKTISSGLEFMRCWVKIKKVGGISMKGYLIFSVNERGYHNYF